MLHDPIRFFLRNTIREALRDFYPPFERLSASASIEAECRPVLADIALNPCADWISLRSLDNATGERSIGQSVWIAGS